MMGHRRLRLQARRSLGHYLCGSNPLAPRTALQRHAAMWVLTCCAPWGRGCSGRDSDIFALHFISSSGPKEMLQQIFFFFSQSTLIHSPHPVSLFLSTSHPHFWLLFSTYVPMAQGMWWFIISYCFCSSKRWQGASWSSSDCHRGKNVPVGLIPGSAE